MGKTRDMSDEQVEELLRERGHTEAANALARKRTAAEAVRRRREATDDGDYRIDGPRARERMRRGYRDGREVLEERKAARTTSRGGGGGGDDDE